MKRTIARTMWIAALAAVCPLGFAQAEDAPAKLRISSELELPIVTVRGPGADQSSLTRGHRYMHAWGLSGSGKSSKTDWFADVRLKSTDDPRMNPQRASLDGLKLQFKQGKSQFAAGDVFESFSQFSLATALKGASLSYGNDEEAGTSFQAVYGTADPRWAVFSPGESGPYIHRTVVGGKVTHRMGESTGVGLSYVRATDSGRPSDTDPLYRNNLVSFTGEIALPSAWKLDGELTWSDTNESPSAFAGDLNYKGRGFRMQAVGPLGRGKMTLQYENVSPGFYTSVGAATSDRERVRARYRQKLDPRTLMTVGLIWYRNNLDNQLATGTNAIRPEFALALTEVGGRPEATLDLSLTQDSRVRGTDRTDDTDIQVNYHDRLGNWDTDWNLGLARYFARDSRDSRELTLGTSWYSHIRKGSLVYRPSLNLSVWKATDGTASSNDASFEFGVGLGIEKPSKGLTCSLKTGVRRSMADLGDSNSRLFANAMLNYRPKEWREFGGGVFFKLGWNDFKYTNGGRDFSEFNFGIGLVFEF